MQMIEHSSIKIEKNYQTSVKYRQTRKMSNESYKENRESMQLRWKGLELKPSQKNGRKWLLGFIW